RVAEARRRAVVQLDAWVGQHDTCQRNAEVSCQTAGRYNDRIFETGDTRAECVTSDARARRRRDRYATKRNVAEIGADHVPTLVPGCSVDRLGEDRGHQL